MELTLPNVIMYGKNSLMKKLPLNEKSRCRLINDFLFIYRLSYRLIYMNQITIAKNILF